MLYSMRTFYVYFCHLASLGHSESIEGLGS